MDERDLQLFVGVDWAKDANQVCALGASGNRIGERSFDHSGNGLSELVDWLRHLAIDLTRVGVGIEVPHGPVVDALLEQGCHVFSLSPKQSDRFRDRFTMSGAKDDRRDAYVLADSLRTDRQCFRELRVEDPIVIQLRESAKIHRDLTAEHVRLVNRIREQLWRYYPQMLEISKTVDEAWFFKLWHLAPDPASGRLLHKGRVGKLLRSHHVSRIDAERIVEILRKPALHVAAGVVEASVTHIRLAIERHELVSKQLRECDRTLEELPRQFRGAGESDTTPGQNCGQRDVEILLSMPGIGRIVLAALLARAATPIRERDYQKLRSLSGVAPVTIQSGKVRTRRNRRVQMRRACDTLLRDAMFHWAGEATRRDPWSRAMYAALRARGHSHGRALRGIADRLLKTACSMLHHRCRYDSARRSVKVA
jgi:transposase